MRKTLRVVIIIGLTLAATWFFTREVDDRNAQTDGVSPGTETSQGGVQDDQQVSSGPSPETTKAEPDSPSLASDRDVGAETDTQATADIAAEPTAPGADPPSATAAAGDGSVPETQQVDETSRGQIQAPDSTGQGDPTVAQAQQKPLAPDSDIGRDATSVTRRTEDETAATVADVEVPDQQPATALGGAIAKIAPETQPVVETPVQSPPQPIPADRADHAVTQEQVISVVPDDAVERVTIRRPDDETAVEGDTPGTDPADDEPAALAATPESPRQEAADTLATMAAEIATGSQPVIETPIQPPPQPIPADRADHAVTQEQVKSVVPDDAVERVTIRGPDDEGAIEDGAHDADPADAAAAASAATLEAPPDGAADTLASVVTKTASETPQVIETPIQPPPLPIPADRADHAVTQEQVVSVVPDDAVERVTIRDPDVDGAIEDDAPVVGPAGVEQKPASTLATGADDTPATEPANDQTLTRSGPLPIPSDQADQAVTQEQVASVVPDDTVERVTISEPNAGDDLGVDATGADDTQAAEPGNDRTPTRSGPQPIPADQADQGVTQEQVVSVVPDDTVERVTISEPNAGDDIGDDATGSDDTQAKEPASDEALTRSGPLPIPSDQAVTQEQVVSVVPDDTVERVTISEPDAGDDLGDDATDTGLAGVGQKLATTLAGVAANIGAEVQQIVETLTEPDSRTDPQTTPQPGPTEGSDQIASGEPIPKPGPSDGPDVPVTHAKVAPPPLDETIEDSGRPESTSEIESEAQEFVETLTEPVPQPIPADRADHFVTQEQVISLVPDDIIEHVTVRELAEDDAIDGDTPITVVRETEQVETVTPERLVAESGGDVETPIRVPLPSGDQVEQTTIGDMLADPAHKPGALIQVVRTVRHFEVTTLKELLDNEPTLDSLLRVIKQPYRIETATLADLLQKQMDEDPDSIFYLHTVLPTDDQGIWGIVHFGIIDNFARGVAIRRGEGVERYTVRIPRDADERLDDNSSSFLGKLIDEKTKESYVYNFREHRVGRNPDRIYPGQELVIINFKSAELAEIYEHFASR